MKILSIGATGMIGSRAVAEALSRGHRVTAAPRSGSSEGLPTDPNLTVVALDASMPSAVADMATGHDAVMCAVSPSRPRLDGSDPAGPLPATYRSLIEGLRGAGVRRLIAV